MKVNIFRLDGESSLQTSFKNWTSSKGILIEQTPPYTKEPNGAAERSGGVMITKARTIRVYANLPAEMWPEAIKTAGYLTNRSPSRQLEWKTPYETLQSALDQEAPERGERPDIAHLKIYGCRAYPLRYNIPKKNKLEPRAHVGYLAGYDSTNIYRIWIPSERRIVRTRDIIFNKIKFYDPDKTDLSDQLRVRAEQILEVIRVDQSGPLMPQETHSDTDTDTDEDGRSDSEQDEQGNQEIEVPIDIDETEQDSLPIGLPISEEIPES